MIYIILSIVGLLAGITASLGIGGGFVLLLYLTVIADMPQREAQLVNLIFFLPIAVVSIILHIHHKLIVKDVVTKSVLGGIVGVFVGVYVATILPNEVISKTFAVFVLIVGVRELIPKKKTHKLKR
ncbi:MAG: TSUP family transporter [Oscillospiraceae bacterium]